MDLILEVRTGRERVTMACHGKLIGGKEADAFRRSALLLMGGFDKLTINLAGVRTVDCGGLGSLASVLALRRGKGQAGANHPRQPADRADAPGHQAGGISGSRAAFRRCQWLPASQRGRRLRTWPVQRSLFPRLIGGNQRGAESPPLLNYFR